MLVNITAFTQHDNTREMKVHELKYQVTLNHVAGNVVNRIISAKRLASDQIGNSFSIFKGY